MERRKHRREEERGGDLLELLACGTTVRAEQGGDVGDEMEVGDGSVRGISSRCQRLDAKQEDAGTDEADGRGHGDGLDSGEACWSRGGRDPAAARLREQRRPRADEWLGQRRD